MPSFRVVRECCFEERVHRAYRGSDGSWETRRQSLADREFGRTEGMAFKTDAVMSDYDPKPEG